MTFAKSLVAAALGASSFSVYGATATVACSEESACIEAIAEGPKEVLEAEFTNAESNCVVKFDQAGGLCPDNPKAKCVDPKEFGESEPLPENMTLKTTIFYYEPAASYPGLKEMCEEMRGIFVRAEAL
jgi:hypothetical protein